MKLFFYPPTSIDTTGLATESEQQAQTALLTSIEDNTDGLETLLGIANVELGDANATLTALDSKVQTLIDEQSIKTFQVSSLLDASSTNITVAPVTLIASTSARTLKIQTIDDIGEYMALYTGGVGVETILCATALGGGEYEVDVPASTRISIGSLGTTITSGKIIINLLGV
jgi:hypothetical protein